MKVTTVKRETVGAHSNVVGGSSAKRRRLCPGSLVEEKAAPKQPGSIWADTGTALHHVVETALAEGLSNKQVMQQFRGVVIKLEDMHHEVDITEELITNKVYPALRFFDTLPQTAKLWLEKKVGFEALFANPPFPSIPGGFGTADVIFDDTEQGKFLDEEAGVVDWKFGDFRPVGADDNDQMRFYLCCAIQSGHLPVLPQYVAYIFQPAAGRDPSTHASRAVYTFDDLALFADDLHDAITGPVRYVPGDHCTDCKGKLNCAAYKAFLTTAVATDVPGMTARELADFLGKVGSIRAWCKDVEAAALRNAQQGVEIPGYGLEPAEGDRTWKDEKAAWGALGRLGVSAEERTVKSTLSAPKALELLVKMEVPAKEIERFAKRHVVRPPRGEKLKKRKPDDLTDTKAALGRLTDTLRARGL